MRKDRSHKMHPRGKRKGRKGNSSNENKAGYTATPVACGRAGAVFHSQEHLGKSSRAKDRKNIKKVKFDGQNNLPTDRPIDKAGCRVA